MKTTIRNILITILLVSFIPWGLYGEESGKEIFDKARLLYLDDKYDQALDQLDRLIDTFPNSSYYPQVLFYKGQCYVKKKMPQRALENFEECRLVSQNKFLKEEAEISIIDMHFALYEQTGRKRHPEEIVRFSKNRNDVVRYYAAFTLSKVKDKAFAFKAVPILKKIIALESDPELVDRAKLALMRIDPTLLSQPGKTKKHTKKRDLNDLVLVIQATDKTTKKVSFSLSLPFALASLAMDSLPEDAKEELGKKGYDLDKIVKTIVENGEILRIESETSIIKIWIK